MLSLITATIACHSSSNEPIVKYLGLESVEVRVNAFPDKNVNWSNLYCKVQT